MVLKLRLKVVAQFLRLSQKWVLSRDPISNLEHIGFSSEKHEHEAMSLVILLSIDASYPRRHGSEPHSHSPCSDDMQAAAQ